MKRLRDMDGDEPLFRRGAELLRDDAADAGRSRTSKARVWRALELRGRQAARALRS